MPPVNFCRLVLSETLKNYTKKDIAEMLKNPDLIPCKYLAINTINCLYNDSRDGPIPDLIKQCIGIEYEVKLKEMAAARKLVFYDEADLRKTGFDKTPDLKLAIPCLYKGYELNWIESKASFGDEESYHKHVKEQLSSYVNRYNLSSVQTFPCYISIQIFFSFINWFINNGFLVNSSYIYSCV